MKDKLALLIIAFKLSAFLVANTWSGKIKSSRSRRIKFMVVIQNTKFCENRLNNRIHMRFLKHKTVYERRPDTK